MYILITAIIIVGIIIFVTKRLMGIHKLHKEIIDLIISYSERHPDCKGLPPADEVFVPFSKMIWSFKKLTLDNCVSEKVFKKLKS